MYSILNRGQKMYMLLIRIPPLPLAQVQTLVHIHKAPYGRAGVVRTTNVLSWAGVGAQISPGWLAQHDAPLCRVLTTRFHEAGEPVA